MGRHSAPDEDDESSVDFAVDRALAPLQRSRPRPARHGGADDGAADGAAEDASGRATAEPSAAPAGTRTDVADESPRAARPRDLQAAAEAEALAEARARAAAERGDDATPAAAERGAGRVYEDVDPAGDDGPVTGPIGIIQAALARSRPRPDPDEPPTDAPTDAPAATASVGPPEADGHGDRTEQIAAVSDPELDRPRPEAVTTELRAVVADAPYPATDEDEAGTAAGTAADGRTPDAPVELPVAPDREAPAGQGSPSDWALLKAQPALRARVAAALVVPFVLYVVVLLTLDAWDVRTGLIWIWIPLVSAGVVAGLLLDLAHRTAERRSRAAGTD